jgi:hypothetical protein
VREGASRVYVPVPQSSELKLGLRRDLGNPVHVSLLAGMDLLVYIWAVWWSSLGREERRGTLVSAALACGVRRAAGKGGEAKEPKLHKSLGAVKTTTSLPCSLTPSLACLWSSLLLCRLRTAS